jgi:hypothetical protein
MSSSVFDRSTFYSDGFVHSILSKKAIYQDIQRTLVKFRYPTLNKGSKGVVVCFLIKITGYSRQQLTRLIKQYCDTAKLNGNSAFIRALNVCIALKIFACWLRLMSDTAPSAARPLKNFASVLLLFSNKHNTNG